MNEPSVENSMSRQHRFRQFFRRIAPALGLALLAPLVREYLLGSTSIVSLPFVWFLMPIYGGAAILIREGARRTGRGWSTILLLGVAFGLVLAGLIDHSLFNSTYFGRNFTDATYIPALGISVTNALDFTVGHAIWGVGVPIAIVETFVPERRTTPWLGNIGLTVTGVLLLIFGGLLEYSLRTTQGFFPSLPQVIGTVVVVVLLVGIAFTVDIPSAPQTDRHAPNPWLIGIISFIASGLWMLRPDIISFLTSGLWGARIQDWLAVVLGIVLITVLALVIRRWARREGWGAAHRLALAGGAMLTYAWVGFVMVPVSVDPVFEVSATVDLIGNIVFTLGAILLLIIAARKVQRTQLTHPDTDD